MSQKDVQDTVEYIEGVIDEVGDFISGCHEYQTRYALVDPILTSLGWDISDVNQVEVEYETNWGRVDYALLESPDGEPAIAVEAKALWTNLETTAIQRQIHSYAREKEKIPGAHRRRNLADIQPREERKIPEQARRAGVHRRIVSGVHRQDT